MRQTKQNKEKWQVCTDFNILGIGWARGELLCVYLYRTCDPLAAIVIIGIDIGRNADEERMKMTKWSQ